MFLGISAQTDNALQARAAVSTRRFQDRAPRFDVDRQIIDWTALTDMATGDAFRALTPMSLNLF
jgi:hypothetical protein